MRSIQQMIKVSVCQWGVSHSILVLNYWSDYMRPKNQKQILVQLTAFLILISRNKQLLGEKKWGQLYFFQFSGSPLPNGWPLDSWQPGYLTNSNFALFFFGQPRFRDVPMPWLVFFVPMLFFQGSRCWHWFFFLFFLFFCLLLMPFSSAIPAPSPHNLQRNPRKHLFFDFCPKTANLAVSGRLPKVFLQHNPAEFQIIGACEIK